MFVLKSLARALVVAASASIVLVAASSAAVAGTGTPGTRAPDGVEDVGLPYNYNVDFITGGEGGVRTPSFNTNSAGKICVSASFKVKKNKDSGAVPDRTFRIELYQENTFGDDRVRYQDYTSGTSTYSYNKICWTGLHANDDHHVRFKKVVYDTGQLTGYGTVSFT